MAQPQQREHFTLQTHRLKEWKMPCNLTLAGFSRAGSATYFFVPELRIQLDMGGFCRDYQPLTYFITHSHMDHCIYLPDVQPAGEVVTPRKVYVPKRMGKYARAFLHSAQELNGVSEIPPGTEKPYEMIEVSPGEVYPLDKSYLVKVVACHHTVDTVGYMFYEKRGKLKEEFQGKSGKEIGELRKQGIEVSEEVKIPKFVFLGDTTWRVFDSVELFEFPVVIVECTFLFKEHESAAEPSGHMNWSKIKEFSEKYPKTTFVLIHWSMRYKVEEIQKFFNEIPGGCPPNIYPWITSVK